VEYLVGQASLVAEFHVAEDSVDDQLAVSPNLPPLEHTKDVSILFARGEMRSSKQNSSATEAGPRRVMTYSKEICRNLRNVPYIHT